MRRPFRTTHLSPRRLAFGLFAVAVSLASFHATGCSTSVGSKSPTAAPTATPAGVPTWTPFPTDTESPTISATRTRTVTWTLTPTNTPCGCIPSNDPGHVRIGCTTLAPQQTPQTDAPQTIGSNQYWWYDFPANAGTTYTFTVCSNGGTYGGDTYFEIFAPACASLLTSDDDTCGLGSELVWTASSSGTTYFQVHGYFWGACTYTLAYWSN